MYRLSLLADRSRTRDDLNLSYTVQYVVLSYSTVVIEVSSHHTSVAASARLVGNSLHVHDSVSTRSALQSKFNIFIISGSDLRNLAVVIQYLDLSQMFLQL